MTSVVFDFLSKFRGGLARSNRYRVEFFLPSGVMLSAGQLGVNTDALAGQITTMQNYFNSKEQVNVKCHSVTLPGRNLGTYEYRQNSAPFRLPYTSNYDPANFSFYADSTMDTRDFFDVWQSAVVNLSTNTLNFPSDYVSDVTIVTMDTAGKDQYSVTLFDAYPVSIGEVSFDYTSQDTPALITVGLEYKYWQPGYNSQGKNSSI